MANPEHLKELYAPGATSREPGQAEPARGLEGLTQKLAMWSQMQKSTSWKARNVFVRGNSIAIEWVAQVTLHNGKTVQLEEVAVHETRGGKIVAERYYYDPSVITSALAPAAPAPSRASAKAPVSSAARPSPVATSTVRFDPSERDEDDDEEEETDDDPSQPDPFDF